MKLKKYNEFILENKDNKVNEELGWKDSLLALATLLTTFGSAGAKEQTSDLTKKAAPIVQQMSKEEVKKLLIDQGYEKAAQKLDDTTFQEIKKGEITTDVKKEVSGVESLRNYIISGFTLNSAVKQIIRDTIKVNPKFTISYDTIDLEIEESQMFKGGEFAVSQETKDTLTDALRQIRNSKQKLASVTVVSSTDKQSLSINLQEKLKSMDLAPTNVGLSQARNNAVAGIIKHLTDNIQKLDQGKSDPTIMTGKEGKLNINQITFAEQGKGQVGAKTEQDPNARYVKVQFVVIGTNQVADPSGSVDVVETVNYIFDVSKTEHGFSNIGKMDFGTGSKTSKVLGKDILSCPFMK